MISVHSREMKVLIVLIASSLLIFLLFIAIENVSADLNTEVGGPIVTDTLWTETESPYIVVTTVDVTDGVTLTIEPGVEVRFTNGAQLYVNGYLIARGTPSGQITFTSNQSIPSPGDWANIKFASNAPNTVLDDNFNYISGSILQHCIVEYAGFNEYYAIYAFSHMIDNCIVRYNKTSPIYVDGSSSASGRVTNNHIYENSGNRIVYATHGIVSGNVVENNIADIAGVFIGASTAMSNTIRYNTSNDYGGLYCTGSEIKYNLIEGNISSGDAGGIWSNNCTVAYNHIIDNEAEKEGGGIRANSSQIIGNIISGNSATRESPVEVYGGGIYALDSDIIDNIIEDNYAAHRGGGIYTEGGEIRGNYLRENRVSWEGGGIFSLNSDVYSNTLISNSIISATLSGDGGSGLLFEGSGNIKFNTIVGNHGPVSVVNGGLALHWLSTVTVTQNTICLNQPYDVSLTWHEDVSGLENYWGTTSLLSISESIYDYYDNPAAGKFSFIPISLEPHSNSPLIPPLNLTGDGIGNIVSLTWDETPCNIDYSGYYVYYDTDNPFPPFTGEGLPEGDSPIDVQVNTTFTLTDLIPSEDYFFTVTAHDDENDESWYSNVIQYRNEVIDISITKNVDNETPNVGTNVVFTIVAANTGPSGATGVEVTDLLPSGYGYVSNTSSQGTYTSGTGVWTLGTIASGGSATLTITGTVNANGDYSNVATLTNVNENDSNSGNDQDSASTTPVPIVDLSITKAVNNATPNVGTNVVFTIVVTNTGPSGATGVEVADLLPSGYTYVNHTVTQGTYTSVTGVWDVGAIALSSTATLTLTATVNASGNYTNVATVTNVNENDSNSGNDQDSASTSPAAINTYLPFVVK